MTTFDDRERAFESMYARDQELQFKIIARRNRLLGQWAAKLMGLTDVEAESYAKDVIRADFEEAGDEDDYSARVVAESFRGLPRVKQHKRVYEALGGRMGGALHALQLTTAVP